MCARTCLVYLLMAVLLAGCLPSSTASPVAPAVTGAAAAPATAISSRIAPQSPTPTHSPPALTLKTAASDRTPTATRPTPVLNPATPALAGGSAVLSSLSFVPTNANLVSLTNWSAVMQTASVEQVDSGTPLEQRQQRHEAFRSLSPAIYLRGAWSGVTMLPPAVPPRMDYFKTWGWDATDLVWEAGVLLPIDGTVRVLRLSGDVDLQAIADSFQKQGFERQEYDGVQVYSYLQTPPADWIAGSDQRHAAVIPDDHVLLHASSPEGLHQVIRARFGSSQSWADLPAFRSMASDFDQMIRADLIAGQFLCARWSIEAWLKNAEADAPLRVELERLQGEGVAYQDLHAYEAFGMGYRIEGEEVLGLITMRFSSPGAAEADLELRSRLITEGNSLVMRQGVPYSQAILELIDAEVHEAAINLWVAPKGAAVLWSALQSADMAYAFCP